MNDNVLNKISIAPMVDRTTNHFRNFFRMFNSKSTLYTEMITAQGLIYGDYDKLLHFDENQKKIVLQIASSDEKHVYEAMKKINKYDYDEININAGCPSNRVSDNKMGAYLMSDIKLLSNIAKVIIENTDKTVTLKHRIGIDGKGILENDAKYIDYEYLLNFVDAMHNIGIKKNIIHARIAILKGLSPRENRSIPPLDYDMVYRLKKDRPNLNIEINGGIKNIEEAKEHLKYVDSVMIGRAAYDNPYLFSENIKRIEILEKMVHYMEQMKTKKYHFIMHTMGLFHGTPYSKIWKNIASNTNINENDVKNFMKNIEHVI